MPADISELVARLLPDLGSDPRLLGGHLFDQPDDAGDALDGLRALRLYPLDHRDDLLGRVRAAARQLLDLARDHRESPARLPGAGGLDLGVEREQLRLLRDRDDQLGDAADLLTGLAQLRDAARGVLGRRHGAAGTRGRGGDPRTDLLDTRGHLGRPLGHRLGPAGAVVGRVGELPAGLRQPGTGPGELAGQCVDHLGALHLPGHVDPGDDVPAGNPVDRTRPVQAAPVHHGRDGLCRRYGAHPADDLAQLVA
jgi:hypothetical protein